jgi:hypothetical protein
MSFRTSRTKFRPTIERCESRNLAAAALTSVAAHAAFPITAAQQEVDVFIKNGTKMKFTFIFQVYENNKLVYSQTKPDSPDDQKTFDGQIGLKFTGQYVGQTKPVFEIYFREHPADLKERLGKTELFPATGKAFTFVSNGPGSIRLEHR